MLNNLIFAVKGAGEMATGTACRLYRAGFKKIYMTEVESPLAVRRKVCFCEAVHDKTAQVEGISACRIARINEMAPAWEKGIIPVIVDPDWQTVKQFRPHVSIDALIAKTNKGTHMAEADLVIGLGPGFTPGKDVHAAIETNRGHNLGRVLTHTSPAKNTGIPGAIRGITLERVLRAPCAGVFCSGLNIQDKVKTGDIIGQVGREPVKAQIDGILRGQIRTGTHVGKGCKIGDIDPRGHAEYCLTISEKARAVGGAVLEAVLQKFNNH